MVNTRYPMRKSWLAISLVVFVIVLVMPISSCSATQNTSSTSTPLTSPMTTEFSGVNSAVSKSVNGLSLSLSLNSTTYRPGQAVSLVIDEQNTLSTTNKVPVSDTWPYRHLRVAQCDFISPLGIAVFAGYYTASNFSTATPLTLYALI
jgi:hypothetical protein